MATYENVQFKSTEVQHIEPNVIDENGLPTGEKLFMTPVFTSMTTEQIKFHKTWLELQNSTQANLPDGDYTLTPVAMKVYSNDVEITDEINN